MDKLALQSVPRTHHPSESIGAVRATTAQSPGTRGSLLGLPGAGIPHPIVKSHSQIQRSVTHPTEMDDRPRGEPTIDAA